MKKIPQRFEEDGFTDFIMELEGIQKGSRKKFSKEMVPSYYKVRHCVEIFDWDSLSRSDIGELQDLFPSLKDVPYATLRGRFSKLEDKSKGEIRKIQKWNADRMSNNEKKSAYEILLTSDMRESLQTQLEDSTDETRRILDDLHGKLKSRKAIIGSALKSRQKLEMEKEEAIMRGEDKQKKIDLWKKKYKRLQENPTVEHILNVLKKMTDQVKNEELKSRDLKRSLKRLINTGLESSMCKQPDETYHVGNKRLVNVAKSRSTIISERTQKRRLEQAKNVFMKISSVHGKTWEKFLEESGLKETLNTQPSKHDVFLMYRTVMKSDRSWDKMVGELEKLTNGDVKLWRSHHFSELIEEYEFQTWTFETPSLIPVKTHPDYPRKVDVPSDDDSSTDSDDESEDVPLKLPCTRAYANLLEVAPKVIKNCF